jgi:hypothetical protein
MSPYTKGTVYDVEVDDYSCAAADGYVKKLVTPKVSNGFPTEVKAGPAGWSCTGSESKTGLAYTPECSMKFPEIGGPGFGWRVH